MLSFDFIESQNQVLAGQDSTVLVTYHLSQEDADTNTNALLYPTTNTTEQIFVRIEIMLTQVVLTQLHLI